MNIQQIWWFLLGKIFELTTQERNAYERVNKIIQWTHSLWGPDLNTWTHLHNCQRNWPVTRVTGGWPSEMRLMIVIVKSYLQDIYSISMTEYLIVSQKLPELISRVEQKRRKVTKCPTWSSNETRKATCHLSGPICHPPGSDPHREGRCRWWWDGSPDNPGAAWLRGLRLKIPPVTPGTSADNLCPAGWPPTRRMDRPSGCTAEVGSGSQMKTHLQSWHQDLAKIGSHWWALAIIAIETFFEFCRYL